MYKRILVAVDGSPTSNNALTAALQMARESDGQVRFIHVVDDLVFFSGLDAYSGYSAELIRIAQDQGKQILADATVIANSAGVAADSILFEKLGDHLAETVAGEARRWDADLVVVGTHGRRGVGRMFLGSGAEQIIRLSPIPVLVVRSQEDAGNSKCNT
ncbi:MAG: universal stress protein, partial [Burkholderiaceae bacterium]